MPCPSADVASASPEVVGADSRSIEPRCEEERSEAPTGASRPKSASGSARRPSCELAARSRSSSRPATGSSTSNGWSPASRDRTDYPEFELIVVDNGFRRRNPSTSLRRLERPFPLETIANSEPASFSDSNAQGAASAPRHDLILFLNNDIEPFERGLAARAGRPPTCGRASPQLARPCCDSARADDPDARDLTVQHRSIKFRAAGWRVRRLQRRRRRSISSVPVSESRTGRRRSPRPACWSSRRGSMRSAASPSGYRFGTEDVDLGLKLTAGGDPLVATGRSILYHRESATQDAEGRDFKRNNRLANRRALPRALGSPGPPRLPARPTPRRPLLDRRKRPARGDHGDQPRPGRRLGRLVHGARARRRARRARLADHLRRAQGQTRWYDLPHDLDYVIALMDPFDLRRVPAEVTTIAWVRNWTERWLERPWFDRADVILASSGRSGGADRRGDRPPRTRFPLATNPAASPPSRQTQTVQPTMSSPATTGARTARSSRRSRPAEGERLDIYGRGWDEVPAPGGALARGPAPYEELPAIYSSAKLVLDDTSGPTLPYGAVNSRVFDALAAARCAITNCEAGRPRAVRRGLPGLDLAPRACASSSTLLLGDDERRAALAQRFRGEVLRHHTYAHRARRLVEILEEHEERPSFCLKIGAPDWEAGRALGRSSFRPGARTGAPRPRPPLPDPGARGVGGRRGADLRRRPGDPRPQPPPSEAGAVQRPLEHQPPRRGERRGVRRL